MNFPKIKTKSSIFILTLLLLIITTAIITIPKSNWKCIFNVNKTATVFTTSDSLYDLSVSNDWTAQGYAWGENIGWLKFSPNSSSKVYVASDALSGYLYGENIGWISLSCRNTNSCGTPATNYGVSNTTNGDLSGYAWGENVGWINFAPTASHVTISATGTFSGYAYGENVGWINFGIGADSAITTWTPTMVDAGRRRVEDEVPVIVEEDDNSEDSQGADVDIDTVPPVITILGSNPVSILVGTTYTDAGATALDGVDGITTIRELSNDVDTDVIGKYTVVYSSTDSTGNIATSSRIVNVMAKTSELPAGLCFGKNLYLYQSDLDVKNLQIFLNGYGYNVIDKGYETINYGQKTQNAVLLFQKDHSSVETGNFDNDTRKEVNDILGCQTIIKIFNTGDVSLYVPATSVPAETAFNITLEKWDSSNKNIKITTGKQLIDNTYYNITAKDTDNKEIHNNFAFPLIINLPFTNLSGLQNLGVYWFDENTQEWKQISNAVFANNQATFTVEHLTTFAVLGSKEEQVVEEDIIPEVVVNNEEQVVVKQKQNESNVSSNTGGVTKTETETTPNQNIPSSDVTESIKQIINSPTGSVVTKTVSTIGIVVGAGASIFAIAIANPITFTEIWLIPAKLFGLLMGALGLKRKNRPWGTVYDSITKRPLDPVYVSLISVETNKEIASAITDIDGRYGFLVLPGKYRIEVKKTNYISPSVIMKGKSFDEVYNSLYFGEEITISKEGEIITKNIPMDSLSFDWNEFAKTKMDVNTFMKGKDIKWAKISNVLFMLGAVVALISLMFAPAPYNFIIAGFYILTYILNYVVFKIKKSGLLTERKTNVPLSFAIIKIFREGEDTPLTKKIADKYGSYYVLLPNGRYFMKVEKKNDDASYSEVLRTKVMEIKNGIINDDFVI